ncbi:hypothetical protein Ciccas_001472 [Cichlidogyrus casuarinus]|uniref:C2H2-type domain-containing protein n=1 Tax=Cichlidogyrus casuarinus TaxID=1844966 RepID=A0ABD2QJW7_9PLAT
MSPPTTDQNNNDHKVATSTPLPPSPSPSPSQPSLEKEPDEEPEVCRVLLVPYKTKQEIEAASEDFTGCPDDFEIIYLDQDTSVDDLVDYRKSEGFHDVLVVNPRIKSMRFYFCGICKLKILTLNDMLRHVIAKHFNFRWKCDICEKTFSRASDRKRHFKNVHESNG